MLALYLDEDSMDQALVAALRARGVDVITATEAQMLGRSDSEQLDYATRQGRVLYTFNRGDFYRLHTQYLKDINSELPCLDSSRECVGKLTESEINRQLSRTEIARGKDNNNRTRIRTHIPHVKL